MPKKTDADGDESCGEACHVDPKANLAGVREDVFLLSTQGK